MPKRLYLQICRKENERAVRCLALNCRHNVFMHDDLVSFALRAQQEKGGGIVMHALDAAEM